MEMVACAGLLSVGDLRGLGMGAVSGASREHQRACEWNEPGRGFGAVLGEVRRASGVRGGYRHTPTLEPCDHTETLEELGSPPMSLRSGRDPLASLDSLVGGRWLEGFRNARNASLRASFASGSPPSPDKGCLPRPML